MSTIITAQLFDAYLKCPTKCFLQSIGETGERTVYAKWFRAKEEAYLDKYIRCITQDAATHEYILLGPAIPGSLKTAMWRLGVGLKVRTQNFETIIQVMERVPSAKRSKSVQLIPIRFASINKVTRNDRMLLAFDSLVLSEMLGHKVCFGKIVHGDKYATLKVKTDTLNSKVCKLISEISLLLSTDSPPNPALNQHCIECEFQATCRQKAIEHDDLRCRPSAIMGHKMGQENRTVAGVV